MGRPLGRRRDSRLLHGFLEGTQSKASATRAPARALVRELLKLRQRRSDDHITHALAGIESDLCRTCRKTKPVDGLHEVALLIKYLNAASAGRDAGKFLP